VIESFKTPNFEQKTSVYFFLLFCVTQVVDYHYGPLYRQKFEQTGTLNGKPHFEHHDFYIDIINDHDTSVHIMWQEVEDRVENSPGIFSPKI